MRSSSVASKSDSLVCPLCEASKLYPSDRDSMRCQSCGGRLSGAMLETLWRISALPDALGSHACECGHPEMRRLPDGTYHCPACGSEVPPADVPSSPSKSEENGLAYWAGWADGCFGARGSFVANPNLGKWETPRTGLLTTGGPSCRHRSAPRRGKRSTPEGLSRPSRVRR
jgi:ribosomal protein L37AE/L43A